MAIPPWSEFCYGDSGLSASGSMLINRRVCVGMAVPSALESLLVASRQVLLEALEMPPPVILRLPRELDPNKKYSWMQKKDEPVSRVWIGQLEAPDLTPCVLFVGLADFCHVGSQIAGLAPTQGAMLSWPVTGFLETPFLKQYVFCLALFRGIKNAFAFGKWEEGWAVD